MPSLSGYIISIYTKLTGYYILFFISALLLIIGIYMSIFIKGLTLNQNIRLLEVLNLKVTNIGMLINIIILVTVLEIQYLIRYLLFLLIQLFLTNKLSVNLIQLWLVLVFSVQV